MGIMLGRPTFLRMTILPLHQRRLGLRSPKGIENGGTTLLPNLVVADRQVEVALLEAHPEDLVDMELRDVGPQVAEAVGLLHRLLVRTMGMVADLLLLPLLEEDSSMPFWQR